MSSIKKYVVVISALREELGYLLSDASINWKDAQENDSGVWYYEGLLKNTDITIIAASALEMGLTTTAIVATKLITKFNPILIIMIGICAGRTGRQVRIGDIVIPYKIIHYQFGTFERNKINQKPLTEETNQELYSLALSLANTDILDDIDTNFVGDKPTEGNLKCLCYPMASADWVVKDTTKLDETRFQDQDVIALDMESYAVVRAANTLKVPYGAMIIKSVSDYADSEKSDRFRAYAKFTSSSFLIKLLLEFNKTRDASVLEFSVSNPITHISADSKILILSAQSQDINYLMQSRFFSKEWGEIVDGNEHRYYTNTLNSANIIATSMSKSGLTEAAIITTRSIEGFQPKLIIVIGTCGGRKGKVKIGDIVLPNKVFHYQYGAFRDGQIDSELRVSYLDDRLLGFIETLSEERNKEVRRQIHQSFRSVAPHKRYPSTLSALYIAPMASADLVVKDSIALGTAISLDRKVVAIDMEGYAIMRAAKHSYAHPGVLIIKAVADYADRNKDDTYRSYASYASVSFCISLLHEVTSKLFHQSKKA